MSVRHHVGDDLILAYAAGELDEATSLLIASHMALCPSCRGTLDTAEILGGSFLEGAAPASVGEADLAAVMARIDAVEPGPPPAPAPRDEGSTPVLPQPLRAYVGGDVEAIRWSNLGGGVRRMRLETKPGGATARLLQLQPGAATPDHGHRGLELTLVLSGSFHDRGAWFRRGDVEEADATVEHQPAAGPEEPCVCLSVTDAPLRFRGLIPRLAQPFLRI